MPTRKGRLSILYNIALHHWLALKPLVYIFKLGTSHNQLATTRASIHPARPTRLPKMCLLSSQSNTTRAHCCLLAITHFPISRSDTEPAETNILTARLTTAARGTHLANRKPGPGLKPSSLIGVHPDTVQSTDRHLATGNSSSPGGSPRTTLHQHRPQPQAWVCKARCHFYPWRSSRATRDFPHLTPRRWRVG
jgi:hypothetical protein